MRCEIQEAREYGGTAVIMDRTAREPPPERDPDEPPTCRMCHQVIDDHPEDHMDICPEHPSSCMVCNPPMDAENRIELEHLDLVFCDSHDELDYRQMLQHQAEQRQRDTDMIIPERDDAESSSSGGP